MMQKIPSAIKHARHIVLVPHEPTLAELHGNGPSSYFIDQQANAATMNHYAQAAGSQIRISVALIVLVARKNVLPEG